MSELMRPIPFGTVVEWMRTELAEKGSIFGVRKNNFYKNALKSSRSLYGTELSSILGPAAGPHSQLTQNIIAAYLCGCRFIELKTVQVMDGAELRACVKRPCIDAEDEGYNVEWSTEMTVQEAFDEYVKAWFALHVLQAELGISEKRDFVFNMSVGYDLEGIKSPKVNAYIDGMKDASTTPVWKECMDYLKKNVSKFSKFNEKNISEIDSCVCNSITLSTLHGCPPDEIERIASYLLSEKKLHTYVKCNPTLLGYERARKIMDSMGYAYVAFDDHHFKADLQEKDALAMFHRLRKMAADGNLIFGVKLTNTFPVKNTRTKMPGDEMYMSGRSLFALTINLAQTLTKEFKGEMPVSYSGGADIFNVEALAKTGVYPITIATTILKPGGYVRVQQMAKVLEPILKEKADKINVEAIAELAKNVTSATAYRKETREYASYKTTSKLPLFDCFKSPCKDGGCPIEQQVPEYLRLVSEGKYAEAFKVISVDNAMPATLSILCDHQCQSKCTRMDYESSLNIRNMKNIAVTNAQDAFIAQIKETPVKTAKKAVVIGAGPAGVATALFLRRNGVAVTVLEKNAEPYGIVRYVIPGFRIAKDMLERDFQLAVKAGVEFKFNVESDFNIADLKKDYEYVVMATGAWLEGDSPVKTGTENLRFALEFLAKSNKEGPETQVLGKRVAVVGGGDVAMDCARAAKRAKGTEEVVLVYRRTREFMPAMKEEIDSAIADGVKVMELHSPVSYDGKTFACEIMTLGDYDQSGRRGVVSTGKMVELQFDAVIASVGAKVCNEGFKKAGVKLDAKGRPEVCCACASSIPNVYIAGDCKAGASTIVRAIADAKAIAKDILAKEKLANDFVKIDVPQAQEDLYARKGVLLPMVDPKKPEDGTRCLVCDQLCEICNDVCPNRANVYIEVESKNFGTSHQIIHLDGMCNECGNCGTFCPHDGRPYKDKVTVFWTQHDFEDSTNVGFLPKGNDTFTVRDENGKVFEYKKGDTTLSQQMHDVLVTLCSKYSYYMSI